MDKKDDLIVGVQLESEQQVEQEVAVQDSLIEYPCRFPIKVMGVSDPDIIEKLVKVVKEFDPDFDAQTVEVRHSSKGKYVGLTFAVWVTSREQLDNIYRALHAHELVKVVL